MSGFMKVLAIIFFVGGCIANIAHPILSSIYEVSGIGSEPLIHTFFLSSIAASLLFLVFKKEETSEG